MPAEPLPIALELPRGSVPVASLVNHQAGDVVREVLRRRSVPCPVDLPEDLIVALVIVGPRQVSRTVRISERTLRRHFVRGGSTVTAFAGQVRLEAARELFSRGWDTDRAAAAFGYSGAAAFRRFLRQRSGQGVWSLRRGVEGDPD